MKSVLLSLLMSLSMALPCWAGSFSFDFNDHSTQLGYVRNLPGQAYGETQAKVRYLYNKDSHTNLGGVALGVIGAPGNVPGLQLGIDLAANGGTTANDQELLVLGLGINTRYAPPMLTGFGVDAHFIYSPEIFTFMDAEDYFELGLGASYQVLPNASIRLAFQNVQLKLKDFGHRDLDQTVRFGVVLSF